MPQIAPNTVIYSIKKEGLFLIFRDNRAMPIVNSHYKIPANLDIPDDVKRIVFTIPANACQIDMRRLKEGLLIFMNPMTGKNYPIKYTDRNGNNIIDVIISEWVGGNSGNLESIISSVITGFQ